MSTPVWDCTQPGDDLSGRTRYRWHVEGWENGEWGMVASPSDSIPEAQGKLAGVARRVPGLTMRIVRETTTYTVEEINVASGCSASISGTCLQLSEGITPCDDICERKSR